MTDSELLEDMNSRLLHHHFIEEHAAAPGSAAGCKFALENRHLQTGVGHVLRSDQRRRATADNRDVDDQVGEQFFGKLPHNRGGDHISIGILLFLSKIKKNGPSGAGATFY